MGEVRLKRRRAAQVRLRRIVSEYRPVYRIAGRARNGVGWGQAPAGQQRSRRDDRERLTRLVLAGQRIQRRHATALAARHGQDLASGGLHGHDGRRRRQLSERLVRGELYTRVQGGTDRRAAGTGPGLETDCRGARLLEYDVGAWGTDKLPLEGRLESGEAHCGTRPVLHSVGAEDTCGLGADGADYVRCDAVE